MSKWIESTEKHLCCGIGGFREGYTNKPSVLVCNHCGTSYREWTENAGLQMTKLDQHYKESPNLFNYGEFKLHAGAISYFLIDCKALTEEDLQVLARVVVDRINPFHRVIGIPEGGLRFAEALRQHQTSKKGMRFSGQCDVLIVDDVVTTGTSMEEALRESNETAARVQGVTIFSRTPEPIPWIYSIFRMEGEE